MLITFERKVPQSSYTSQNDHKSKGYPSKTSAFTMRLKAPWASAFEIDFQKSNFPALFPIINDVTENFFEKNKGSRMNWDKCGEKNFEVFPSKSFQVFIFSRTDQFILGRGETYKNNWCWFTSKGPFPKMNAKLPTKTYLYEYLEMGGWGYLGV